MSVKGSWQRSQNDKKFNDNYELIWGKKNEPSNTERKEQHLRDVPERKVSSNTSGPGYV